MSVAVLLRIGIVVTGLLYVAVILYACSKKACY